MTEGAFKNDFDSIATKIDTFSREVETLNGLSSKARLTALIKQIISSLRRIQFVRDLDKRPISAVRTDPTSPIFDPLRAAVLHRNNGNVDEAIWVIFLATHFGKHATDGWRLMRDVYGAFGQLPPWTWKRIAANKQDFATWAINDLEALLADGVSRRFSNHRKYESRKPEAIVEVVGAYVDLVLSFGGHREWLVAAHKANGQNPKAAFDFLYKSLGGAKRFGRLGRFDFLTMLGKLELMPIEPGIAYLEGATGPLRGVRLLVDGNPESATRADKLEALLVDLDGYLGIGMQALEDSLCNWQKSPDAYLYFRG